MTLEFNQTGAGALASSDLKHRYLWNPAAVDELLAAEQVTNPASTGTVLWALTDHQASVRDVVDSTGTLLQHKNFDSFGKVLSETHYNASGGVVTSGQAGYVDVAFAYTGRFFDKAMGMQNNLHRWYEASTGKWLSEDPIGFAGGDANLYRYVGNMPAMYTDPSGLINLPIIITGPPSFYDTDIIDRGRTVARNARESGYGTIGTGYLVIGVIAGDETGVTGVIDCFSEHDAVYGHRQSMQERITDGLLGGAQLGLIGYGGAKASSPFINRGGRRGGGLTQQQPYQQQQGKGSYTNYHESGRTYSGKGNANRANRSASTVATEHGDPLTSQECSPAANTRQSFIVSTMGLKPSPSGESFRFLIGR